MKVMWTLDVPLALTSIYSSVSPFSQVAGEVLSKADDTPVLSFVDPLKSLAVGQRHLDGKSKRVAVNTPYISVSPTSEQ